MKAKWSELINEAHGGLDSRHYARQLPGQKDWACVCSKPELSKNAKKKKAEHWTAKRFGGLIGECRKILNNPERRAAWQELYDAAKRKAEKHKKTIQGRLCDYVRHEVSEKLKRGDAIVP